MIAARVCLAPVLLLLPFFVSPALGARKTLSITLDGFADPGPGDSASVGIVAQIDSIAGVALGPLVVSCRVRDDNGHTLLDKERVEPVPKATAFPRLVTWSFRSAPGKLKVRFQAKGLDFEGDGRADLELYVPQFSKEAFPVSTPKIGTLRREGAPNDTGTGFRMAPSHRFVTGEPVLVLLSLGVVENDSRRVNEAAKDSLGVRLVLSRNSRLVKDSTLVVRGTSQVLLRENPARWGGGQYAFQITLTAPVGTVRRTGEFQVAAGGADLLRDPVLVRTVLGYIATGQERLAIETAPTDSLPGLWDRFWKRRDPSPGTAANEALDRFLDRVSQATNRFGGVVPGWRSDRGRILIQHGDPKRTERVFDPTTRTETEIWYYDDRNISYVFQDPEGFGNYRLTGGQ